MRWCSIDPGYKGAGVLWSNDMPVGIVRLSDVLGDAAKRRRVATELFSKHAALVIVEKVHGIRGDGAASAFTFGFVCGMIHQAFPNIVYLDPNKWMWQMHAGLPKATRTKERSYIVAALHYAEFMKEHNATLKKDDGVWDALLIGKYAWCNGLVAKGNGK
jgi:hypothetical protein